MKRLDQRRAISCLAVRRKTRSKTPKTSERSKHVAEIRLGEIEDPRKRGKQSGRESAKARNQLSNACLGRIKRSKARGKKNQLPKTRDRCYRSGKRIRARGVRISIMQLKGKGTQHSINYRPGGGFRVPQEQATPATWRFRREWGVPCFRPKGTGVWDDKLRRVRDDHNGGSESDFRIRMRNLQRASQDGIGSGYLSMVKLKKKGPAGEKKSF